MSSSNCCFLTCIQVSQEAGPVVWYSHLFQNFPQFIVIHTVKGFGIVNKAEIDVFPEHSCKRVAIHKWSLVCIRHNILKKDEIKSLLNLWEDSWAVTGYTLSWDLSMGIVQSPLLQDQAHTCPCGPQSLRPLPRVLQAYGSPHRPPGSPAVCLKGHLLSGSAHRQRGPRPLSGP